MSAIAGMIELIVRDQLAIDRELTGVPRQQVTVIEACGRMFSPCCGSTTHDRAGTSVPRRGAAHFVQRSEDRQVHHDEHDHGDDHDAFGMLRSA